MTLEEWNTSGQYFNYHKNSIFYRDEGEGAVLLLIHGFPTASWDWAKIWKPLTNQYRVVALDMIGFGFSDKPRDHHYSILDQADLHECFLKEKGIEQVKILSHDYGDTVAQELLARFNERQKTGEKGVILERVCFLNGGLFPETHEPLLIQRLLMSPLGPMISRLFNRKKLAKNFKRIFGPDTQPTDQELDEFWELMTHNHGKRVTHLLIRYMSERVAYRERWLTAMTETSVPLRLIDGTYDPISGKHMVERYRELIPNPDVTELDNIGHYPATEAPDKVLAFYLDFIK